jgi:hypothetical protein
VVVAHGCKCDVEAFGMVDKVWDAFVEETEERGSTEWYNKNSLVFE